MNRPRAQGPTAQLRARASFSLPLALTASLPLTVAHDEPVHRRLEQGWVVGLETTPQGIHLSGRIETADRHEPPDRIGGHEHLPLYDPLWYNCDGMRVISTGWWNAFVVSAADSAADYQRLLAEVLAGLHEPMGERARACVQRGFSWDDNLPEVVLLLGDQGAVPRYGREYQKRGGCDEQR